MSRLKPLTVPDSQAARVELAVFDFDGVFTDNTVYVNDKGEEMVRFWRGDGLGLIRLKETGVRPWVISTELNPVVAKRCQKLKISYRQGLAKKEKALVQIAEKLKIAIQEVAYVGNDINDIECLRLVGVPIVVADAGAEVKKVARYQTRRSGGQGAVREVCDWIVACKRNK